jgi:transketolase
MSNVAKMHLAAGIGTDAVQMKPIRTGFGEGLLAAAQKDDQIVGLCADLTDSTKMKDFAEAFPERFIEIGVAEQNLVTVAAGMAALGKHPFASSYAAFCPGRDWEQIRTTICLNDRPVTIAGSHAGLYTGADGATHQMLEDLAIMRALPNMIVVAPGDAIEAAKATQALARTPKPSYIRLTREGTAVFTTDDTPFEIGRAYVLKEGKDITLLGTGTMTYPCLVAAKQLEAHGIQAEVVHVPTIKPLDHVTILGSVMKTGKAITVEEAQINGGLGSAVAELLGEHHPAPLKRMGMQDHFGESGKPEELLEAFGLTPRHIAEAATTMLKK